MLKIVESLLAGDRLSLARVLTHAENASPGGLEALNELFPYTGKAHFIGITGAPGVGKSSLVNQMALGLRKQGKRVAIIAVDPSSPFTGGAVLGDRVRMRDLAGDPGIFIRSMASRGSLGGLAQATASIAQVFDAAGFEIILIETVGAGQSEVDIARLAHTTLVVEAPGLGDDIQAIKAGILEIADILVVNKADRPGADATERALKAMLDLAHPVQRIFLHHGQALAAPVNPQENLPPGWIPPVQRVVSTDGDGISALLGLIDQHRAYLRESGEWARREQSRLETEFHLALQDALMARFHAAHTADEIAQLMHAMQERKHSPRSAVAHILGIE